MTRKKTISMPTRSTTRKKLERTEPRMVPRYSRGSAQPKSVEDYSPLSILSQAELARVLNLSVSTLKKMQKEPSFPKRRQIPGGPRGWLFGEIEQFILSAPVDEAGSDDDEDGV